MPTKKRREIAGGIVFAAGAIGPAISFIRWVLDVISEGQTASDLWQAAKPWASWIYHGTPIWLNGVLMLIGIGLLFSSRKSRVVEPEGATEQQPPDSPPKFRDVNDFYRTYDNVLLRECEDNVRKMAAEYPPNKQREDFLLRNIATLTVLGIFEMTWWNIFKSQLDALDLLNKKNLTLDELRAFYDEGKTNYPHLYEGRSFEAWLAFMRNYVLIVEEGEIVKITVRGKEFLKYMVHCSYDPKLRVG